MRPNGHHTKDKGDLAVAKTIADLTEKGYVVFRPVVSEHCHYDLLALEEDTGKFYRIQCKYSKDGHARKTTTWTNKSGCKVRKYEDGDFDYYAIFLPDINTVVYPSIKFMGCMFRSTLPNAGSFFYWYEDFLNFTDEAEKKNIKSFGVSLTGKHDSRINSEKVEWPTKEALEKLLLEKSSVKLGKDFGVDRKTIEMWATHYGLTRPPRGYFRKLQSKK